MIARRASCLWLAIPAMLAIAWCGCSHHRSQLVAENVTPQRERRREQTVQEFEAHRDKAQYQSALACWEQGNLTGCQESLAALLKRTPDHFEGNYLLAELYFLNDQAEEALPVLQRLAELQPNEARVQHTLGLVLARMGEREEATRHLAKAAEFEPDNLAFARSLAGIEQGGYGRQPFQAVSHASSSPGVAEFEALYRRGDHHEAQSWLMASARSAASDEQQLISLAVLALRHNEPVWAVEVLQSADTRQAASAAYCRALGTAYYARGEYAGAEVQLRQSLALDNTSALSYFLLGCTLSRQDRSVEAEPLLREACRLDPRYARAP